MARRADRKRSRSPVTSSRSRRRSRSREPLDRDRHRSDRTDRNGRKQHRNSRSPDRRRERDRDAGSTHRSRSPRSYSRSSPSPSDRHRSNRDREKERSNGQERSRSRSPSHHRSSATNRRSSQSPDRPNRERVEDIIGRNVTYQNFDMEQQYAKLERIMQERRDRVSKWRLAQKQQLGGDAGDPLATGGSGTVDGAEGGPSGEEMKAVGDAEGGETNGQTEKKKKWTLDDDVLGGEDDDDDDEDDEPVPMDDDDDGENTLSLPQRSTDTGGDEDKIEKVVSGASQNLKSSFISYMSNNFQEKSKNEKSTPETVATVSASTTEPKSEVTENTTETSITAETTADVVAVEPTVATESAPEAATQKMEADEEEDDIDPLDAYMQGIQEEVKKYRTQTHTRSNDRVTLVVGVAKKKSDERNRGELMEQNQDAMEFSSGDEMNKEDDLANAMDNLQSKVKQKKQLTISKDDITYIPFRKNFYIEVPEITKMTAIEVEAFKTEMEGIKTKGKGCPRPIKTWAQCGVSKKVLDVLKKNNFEKPTPIQCQAIPAIMSGRDLIGIAKTGSGKTLAFLIPMFRHILDQPRLQSGDGPIAIIMTPTRELATQIYGQCRKFTKYLSHMDRGAEANPTASARENRLRVVAVYGGTPISEQIGDLKPGAEIVVCTPGRMIDMLAANSGRVTNLRRCTYVVLDEADRMFDMGFEPQVMRIIDGIRPDRQTVMFSATFPRIMEALARRILDKPIEVQVGGRSVVCKEVEQNVVIINEDDKFLKLLEVLGKFATQGSAITFVDKQEHADMLLKELMHASYTCLALHGGIDQNDRDSTISDFKNGKVNVLVATSVAARGLDVKHCIVVINYDCPNHYEDYVHRCGRTGRAGNKGYAYTFLTPEQGRYSTDVIKALEQSGNAIPADLQKLFDNYKREQEMQGKKVKSSSGFSGKGFKFDEAEAQQALDKKKLQKAALGLNDSDDEDEEGGGGGDIEQEIENMLAPKKKTINTVTGQTVSQSGVGTAATAAAGATGPGSTVPNEAKTIAEKMELVKQAASRIAQIKAPTMGGFSSTQAHTEAYLKGDAFSLGDIASAVNAKSLAEQRAERLHAKLNYIPRDSEYNENGELIRRDDEVMETSGPPGTQRFEEELEINDFPQQARWRVTSKEAIAMISEYSEAGITVRGTFFQPGKEPGLGERKLYLAIEGTNEMAVSKARAEIIRLIKEELVKMSNSNMPLNKGRYKVL